MKTSPTARGCRWKASGCVGDCAACLEMLEAPMGDIEGVRR